jgi:hypothetical protein
MVSCFVHNAGLALLCMMYVSWMVSCIVICKLYCDLLAVLYILRGIVHG